MEEACATHCDPIEGKVFIEQRKLEVAFDSTDFLDRHTTSVADDKIGVAPHPLDLDPDAMNGNFVAIGRRTTDTNLTYSGSVTRVAYTDTPSDFALRSRGNSGTGMKIASLPTWTGMKA